MFVSKGLGVTFCDCPCSWLDSFLSISQQSSFTELANWMADRDKYVYMAKLAEQAEKYDGELSS